MPAPGSVWAAGAWDVNAWAADTWPDAGEGGGAAVVPASLFGFRCGILSLLWWLVSIGRG